MFRISDGINRFNYTKTGIIIGFILGTLTTAMGVLFTMQSMNKKDVLLTFCSFATLAIGVFAISMEIYRLKKLRRKNS